MYVEIPARGRPSKTAATKRRKYGVHRPLTAQIVAAVSIGGTVTHLLSCLSAQYKPACHHEFEL